MPLSIPYECIEESKLNVAVKERSDAQIGTWILHSGWSFGHA